ncbi:MAG: hypothetical protein U5K43_06310 [Halofilum sp. (in: g-proteobacteria)]|nr:hypothetical protein [Halofilum sp. (in: g-proteobacteria)]
MDAATHQLDARGLACPQPMLRARAGAGGDGPPARCSRCSRPTRWHPTTWRGSRAAAATRCSRSEREGDTLARGACASSG